MDNFLNFKKQNDKGFSILETLIAITVITIGLVGVTGLIIYTLSISRMSPEKVIAVNLAQEGIEAVRNIRDSNWLEGKVWNQDLAPDDYYLHMVDVDDLTQGWVLNPVGGAPFAADRIKVYYDPNDKFYGQRNPPAVPADWEATVFTRMITITDNPDGNPATEDIKVECQVDWSWRGISNSILVENYLYNWR